MHLDINCIFESVTTSVSRQPGKRYKRYTRLGLSRPKSASLIPQFWTKGDRRLKAHPDAHLHFVPNHSSWLTHVQCWFSILSLAPRRAQASAAPGC